MSFDESVYRDQLYTEQQSRILVNVPRLTGTLSILGSSVIIYIILNDKKHKLRRVYHRILLAYSISDILCSFNYVLSSVVVPRNTPGVWGAMGTTATCEASGFIVHFTFSLGVYGSFICIYYVLVLRYNVREETLARKVEPLVHFVAIIIPIALGSVMLYKDMYNPANIFVGWCFMNCYPMDCLRREEIQCERGADYEFWVLLHNTPFLGFFLSVVVSCVLTFEKVRSSERRAARWTASRQQSKIRLRESAAQAFLYIAAFMLTYLSFGVAGLLGPQPATIENRGFYFPMVLSAKTFLPLQGFFNCYIYIRPRYNAIRRRQRELTWYSILYAVISGNDTETQLNESARRVRMIRSAKMLQSMQQVVESIETQTQSRVPEGMTDDDDQDYFTPEFLDSKHFDTGPLWNLPSSAEANAENEVDVSGGDLPSNNPQSPTDPEQPLSNETFNQMEDLDLSLDTHYQSNDVSWTESMEEKVFSA